LTGGARWPTNEPIKIAETIQIEEKVVFLHTAVQNKGLSSTAEVARTGGRRNKKSIDICHIVILFKDQILELAFQY